MLLQEYGVSAGAKLVVGVGRPLRPFRADTSLGVAMASKSTVGKGSDKNVTKKHLVDTIAAETKLPRGEVQRVVQGMLDQLVEAVREGHRVELRDFGVFEVKARAARTAQNPKTLEPVTVPPKLAVRFKPGRLMKEALEAKQAPVARPQVDPSLNGHAVHQVDAEPPVVAVPSRKPVAAGAAHS